MILWPLGGSSCDPVGGGAAPSPAPASLSPPPVLSTSLRFLLLFSTHFLAV